ncbi:MAG: type II secretion system protein GspE [Verrucomicrobiae bacterium]|nr:type II secretion system protein GspE [Verrucomicrobiae bacterium]
MKSFGERIADLLIEDGLLLPQQFDEALAIQKKDGGRLLKVLQEKKYVTEDDMMISIGRCLGTPPVNLPRLRIPPETMQLISKEMAQNYKMIPVAKVGNRLFVAMADPMNVIALDDLRQATKLNIVPMISTEKAVIDCLSNVSAQMKGSMEEILRETDVPDLELTKEGQEEINLDKLVESSEEGPVIKIVNLLLLQAIKDRASDIHIEPFEKKVRLRYRVDGVLYDSTPPPKFMQQAIASRIKIMANLDIAERRLPQDGRFRIKIAGREIDLRVSILPTVYGEKIVMRVLDKGCLASSLDSLGMDEHTLGKFRDAIDQPHGMILVTGPTGSGKTTTLYSVLQELNSPEYNIVTVEDPVEYQLMGINQVQVKPEIGLTFAGGLRSILRQDPDIVMIGEIRDNETADIAVKAALTGHQVLSTLHTNDAAGAIARLVDMGIEPFLVASSILMTCAQRLVRRICPNCKEPVVAPKALLERLAIKPEPGEKVEFFRGRGCERCKKTGFLGRAAIIEALRVSEQIRKLVVNEAKSDDVKRVALAEGMKTLRMVGILKAREGVTSLEEVFRTTAADD